MNGVHWWFTQGLAEPLRDTVLQSVDPGGALKALWPAGQVIGCVVHAAAAAIQPGEVALISAANLLFGEADGRTTPRLERLAQACRRGGVDARVEGDIRLAIWRKLWGNMSMNPLSALARASTGRLLDDPLTSDLVRAMMREMAGLGARLGLDLGMTPDDRMAITRRLGDFKTSMQRDAEAGRRLEIDGLLGALVELGEIAQAPVPTLAWVYGLVRQLDASLRSLPA